MTANRQPDRLAAAHERLTAAVDALLDGPAWRTLLTVAARCHRYSPSNQLLIATQRPDATYLLGYASWNKLGRQVRSGERSVAILAPVTARRRNGDPDDAPPAPHPRGEAEPRAVRGWRVAHVFDIAQTDGPDLSATRPALLDGAVAPGLYADLSERVAAAGYTVTARDVAPANGVTDHRDRVVAVRPDLPARQQVKTLAHELAHVLLHAPDTRPDAMTRARAEVEAESVAYVVTAAHGLAAEDYTVPYVAGWSGGDRDLVASTATRVLACAREILAAVPPPSAAGPDVGLAATHRVAGRNAARRRDDDGVAAPGREVAR